MKLHTALVAAAAIAADLADDQRRVDAACVEALADWFQESLGR